MLYEGTVINDQHTIQVIDLVLLQRSLVIMAPQLGHFT